MTHHFFQSRMFCQTIWNCFDWCGITTNQNLGSRSLYVPLCCFFSLSLCTTKYFRACMYLICQVAAARGEGIRVIHKWKQVPKTKPAIIQRCVCMDGCMNVCMFVCMYVCLFVWMYVCIYLSIYLSIYVCMYICMCVWL